MFRKKKEEKTTAKEKDKPMAVPTITAIVNFILFGRFFMNV